MEVLQLTREQIEQLQAGRELDALVAKLVMGWTVAHYAKEGRCLGFKPNATNYYEAADGSNVGGVKRSDLSSDYSYWSPSTDIKAAWEVVQHLTASTYMLKMNQFWIEGGSLGGKLGFRVAFQYYRSMDEHQATADTISLAICRAALLSTLT
jgi:hypothetical protein